MVARRLLLAGMLILGFPVTGPAQGTLRVAARTSDGSPISHAVVIALSTGTRLLTDRLGRASFPNLARPQRLVVLYVGFVPDTLTAGTDDTSLVAVLVPRIPTLADLTIFAGEDALTPSMSGQWVMPRQLLQELPVAVEPDPLRALALVPSVSFSSPLSARPLLRGYDADESVVRLDGYEIANPYHIARAFSGITADALDRVVVSPASTDPGTGGTLAGTIDLYGRGASTGAAGRGGVAVSPVSLVGWYGGGREIPVFGALRFGFLEAFTGLLGQAVPYSFRDGYLHSLLNLPASRALDITGYSSNDKVGDAQAGQGMDWSNRLVGLRLRIAEAPHYSIDVGGSANRFSLSGTELPIRGSLVDLVNEVSRSNLNVTLALGEVRQFHVGAAVSFRHARTDVSQLSGDQLFPPAADSRLVEYQTFAEGAATIGRSSIEGGIRLDASARARALQPRVRIARALGVSLSGSLSYARTSRLFFLISDPQPEPQLLFPQFWLTAGQAGVPVPVVDHFSASIDWRGSRWLLSGSAYASRGRHIGELRPETDPLSRANAFRFGDSRTAGIELRTAREVRQGSPPVFAVTYVLSWSDRRFESGQWRAWKLNRTHLLRLQASKAVRTRWFFFAVMEVQSGQPLTLVREVVRIDPPPVDAPEWPGTGPVAYRYADENSSRSDGTLRFDIGAQLRLRGPLHTRLAVGASVINAGFGPVAPQSPVPADLLYMLPSAERLRGVPYRRAYSLPAVPTITARLEF